MDDSVLISNSLLERISPCTVIEGSNNILTGNCFRVIGDHNRVTGDGVSVEGDHNTVIGKDCTVTGFGNRYNGTNVQETSESHDSPPMPALENAMSEMFVTEPVNRNFYRFNGMPPRRSPRITPGQNPLWTPTSPTQPSSPPPSWIPKSRTQPSPPPQKPHPDSVAEDGEPTCSVCFTNAVCIVLRPCNHARLCRACHGELKKRNKELKCPSCRTVSTSFDEIIL